MLRTLKKCSNLGELVLMQKHEKSISVISAHTQSGGGDAVSGRPVSKRQAEEMKAEILALGTVLLSNKSALTRRIRARLERISELREMLEGAGYV